MQRIGPRISQWTLLGVSRRCVRSARCRNERSLRPSWRQLSTEHVSPSQVEPFSLQEDELSSSGTSSAGLEGDRDVNTIQPKARVRRTIPFSCPGCGALSQRVEKDAPGHYTRTRNSLRLWLKGKTPQERSTVPDASDEQVEGAGDIDRPSTQSVPVPFCDRCHELVHSNKGVSIDHPSIEAIADSIAESPHKQNHVYHVMDAADFPMSLIRGMQHTLEIAKPRSRNRRSQHDYTTRATMSYIITRSDLLAPTQEKVDRLMPYFREVLRNSLGRSGENARLGNLHLVSAKRGWWTKELKEEIWNRGGGNWLVGKFNVGKSNLFEVIFPKGSGERAPVYSQLLKDQESSEAGPDYLPETKLLPPPQPEVPFPTLPLVSSLPGTTASPIRLPFGNKKGELVDMPGLERSNLDHYVTAEHKGDLLMESRPKILQHNIKSGQSLLLGGGLIRITPMNDNHEQKVTMLAYPFVPLEAHVTATEKAIGAQSQERESGIPTILAADVGSKFRSAGIFTLDTDVTKQHAGPLLRAGVNVSSLPFRIFATDILIQGIGWVELVCQVRRARQSRTAPTVVNEPESALPESDLNMPDEGFQPFIPQGSRPSFDFPQVEVFTPEGAHISSRPTMNAWTLYKEDMLTKDRSKGVRPRQPMKGAKARGKKPLSKQRASA